jgi:hypothetical protein
MEIVLAIVGGLILGPVIGAAVNDAIGLKGKMTKLVNLLSEFLDLCGTPHDAEKGARALCDYMETNPKPWFRNPQLVCPTYVGFELWMPLRFWKPWSRFEVIVDPNYPFEPFECFRIRRMEVATFEAMYVGNYGFEELTK